MDTVMTLDQLITALKAVKKSDPSAGKRPVWVTHSGGTNVGPAREVERTSGGDLLITQ